KAVPATGSVASIRCVSGSERGGRRLYFSPALFFGDFRCSLRFDDRARTNALQAIDDHAVARLQTAFHDPLALDCSTELDLAIGDRISLIHDEDELLVLVRPYRRLADEQVLLLLRLAQSDPHELARYQPAV